MDVVTYLLLFVVDGRKWSCCFNQLVDKSSCRFQIKKLKIHLIAKKELHDVHWQSYEVCCSPLLFTIVTISVHHCHHCCSVFTSLFTIVILCNQSSKINVLFSGNNLCLSDFIFVFYSYCFFICVLFFDACSCLSYLFVPCFGFTCLFVVHIAKQLTCSLPCFHLSSVYLVNLFHFVLFLHINLGYICIMCCFLVLHRIFLCFVSFLNIF